MWSIISGGKDIERPCSLRLHLTNVTGQGSSQLLLSLLPSIIGCAAVDIEVIYGPEHGPISRFLGVRGLPKIQVYRRWLPHSLSRLVECFFFEFTHKSDSPILVFGDLPLWCSVSQTIFVHQAHLFSDRKLRWWVAEEFKFPRVNLTSATTSTGRRPT